MILIDLIHMNNQNRVAAVHFQTQLNFIKFIYYQQQISTTEIHQNIEIHYIDCMVDSLSRN
jgi:hypothetical protein